MFLSVGIFVTEASSPRAASASPAGSASGSVSNGYNFCLGVSRTNAAVNVQCITRTIWSSVKSTRTTGYNLQIKGMCLTAPSLKDGQDLFASACGASAAAQQDWVGLPNGGIGLINSNFCLDVEVGVPKDGSPIQIYTCQGLANGTTRIAAQRWFYGQNMFSQIIGNPATPSNTSNSGIPLRGDISVPAVATTVYNTLPASKIRVVPPITNSTVAKKVLTSTPPSQPSKSKCKGLTLDNCVDQMTNVQVIAAIYDAYYQFVPKNGGGSLQFSPILWGYVVDGLSSAARNNTKNECINEARKNLKKFHPDMISRNLDSLDQYVTALDTVYYFYSLKKSAQNFIDLLRYPVRSTVLEQMLKVADAIRPDPIPFTKELVSKTTKLAKNLRKKLQAQIDLNLIGLACQNK